MKIVGTNDITFVLLSGIAAQNNIKLSNNVELQQADTSHLDLKTALSTCTHPDDIAVVAAFIPRITAQLRISAETPEELAKIAWNSSWDVLLLSAIFQTEVGFNLQSDTTSNKITADSILHATNLHMYGLNNDPPYSLTSEDAKWILTYFSKARSMLDNDSFQTAVHCLASYRWHSVPRIKIAVIWAGIEGLFGVQAELKFRMSVCIARFLFPDDPEARQDIYNATKKLYNIRSAAVHGSKIKGGITTAVEDSADILCKLLVRCTEIGSLPDENELIP